MLPSRLCEGCLYLSPTPTPLPYALSHTPAPTPIPYALPLPAVCMTRGHVLCAAPRPDEQRH